MKGAAQEMTWKEIAAELINDFISWGCPYSRKKLPEIALGYDCTSLFFWNWMEDEEPRTEKSFLRVVGYAWRKHLEEEADPDDRHRGNVPAVTIKTVSCRRKAA